MDFVSLLHTLLHRSAPDKPDKSPSEPEGCLPVPPTFILDRGMPVEVMKDFDTVLLFGRLAAYSPSELTIEHIPGEKSFPVCRIGGTVLVRGYDARMDPVLLRGRVACSSWAQCVVGDLKRISYETQRKGARHPLTPPAGVRVLEDSTPDRPQSCQLLNISTGGACVVSERSYHVGQPLHLWVGLAKKPERSAVYHCRVVRATPRSSGCFEYGLLFTRMDESTRSGLTRDIQSIHEETEQKLLFNESIPAGQAKAARKAHDIDKEVPR